jgi:hypothetical protein
MLKQDTGYGLALNQSIIESGVHKYIVGQLEKERLIDVLCKKLGCEIKH